MKERFLLYNETAAYLYEKVKDLPIYDYHCHLSPKEIYEDKVFDNIGEMWLAGDHYKWRLMRQAGVDERFITGSASWHDKFIAFAKTIQCAAGNPLYHWSMMELSMFFDIDTPLDSSTAEAIWEAANAVIWEKQLSPRKLIRKAGVAYIATTDDVADTLYYHELLQKDPNFDVMVAPSFRTDQLLLIRRKDYREYITRLSAAAGVMIRDIEGLLQALERQLTRFLAMGCKFTDVGIPDFPLRVSSKMEADQTFSKALRGEEINDYEYNGFLGYMYTVLGRLYKQNQLVMQWHLAVLRNTNSTLYKTLGPDCGGDCVGDVIAGSDIAKMLDVLERLDALPETILYTLNGAMLRQLCSVAGSFRGVHIGAAWWFEDHKQGIDETICTIAQTGYIDSFLGMLTDSRSFLSYARHDYFRRILCSRLGEFVEKEEFPVLSAQQIARNICVSNIKKLILGGHHR